MLFAIGPLVFDLVVNISEFEHDSETDFARKDVVGARKPFEFVGPGDETLRFTGTLFPERLGGSGAVEALRRIQATGAPQLVIRGDGKIYGFFVIKRLSFKGQSLDAAGAPRRIDVSIELERTDQPSTMSVFSALVSLFG